MVIVAMWTWTDIEIKKMQPYIDLIEGDSPPQKSLLLDYTRTKCVLFSCLHTRYWFCLSNFVVWISAFWNRHYMVALATLIALLALVFQPLGAAIFEVRDTWWGPPRQFLRFVNTTSIWIADRVICAAVDSFSLAAVSLNQGPTFQDLTGK